METHAIDVRGSRMHWLEQGEGQPVVYLHSIPASPRLWRHVIPRVRGARSLAWEMVGYGTSIDEGRNRDIGVARQAEYLADWMEMIGLERAIIVGHDLGGGVAQILAVRRPGLVAGLVLMNAISYDSWPIPSVKLLRVLAPLVRRVPKHLIWPIIVSVIARGHDDWSCMKESLVEHWQFYDRPDGANLGFLFVELLVEIR